MALSSAVVSFDIADLLGNDFNPAKTKVSVTTNVPDGVIADTVGNQIRVGDGVVQIGADGTGTVSVWIPGTGSNPASWQTYIHLDAAPNRAGVGRAPKTFGPFTITGDANLADLIDEQEVPPTYLSTVTTLLDGYVDEAEAAKTAAQAAAAAASALVISDLGTTDGQTRALVENPASQTTVALKTVYASANPTISGVVLDGDGNRTAWVENGVTCSATYDPATGNMSTLTVGGLTRTFAYDSNGNMTGAS